jgi:pimeloyl-ACP methyl ester carboxylesterase
MRSSDGIANGRRIDARRYPSRGLDLRGNAPLSRSGPGRSALDAAQFGTRCDGLAKFPRNSRHVFSTFRCPALVTEKSSGSAGRWRRTHRLWRAPAGCTARPRSVRCRRRCTPPTADAVGGDAQGDGPDVADVGTRRPGESARHGTHPDAHHPPCRTYVFPNCGHWAMIEAKPAFEASVLAFLGRDDWPRESGSADRDGGT